MKINPDVWAIVEDACQMDGLEDVRHDYVGRGVGRNGCIAVVAHRGCYADVIRFMINVVEALTRDVTQQKNWMITMSEKMLSDDMGLDTIFYFPGWVVSNH